MLTAPTCDGRGRAALRRMAGLGYVACRRSPRRSPRGRVTRASRRRRGCAATRCSCRRWIGSWRTFCCTRRATSRRDLAWVRLDDVLLHFPFLVRDNLAASRDVVLTADAANDVVAAFADEFPLVLDQPPAARPGRRRLAHSARNALRADRAPAGTRRPDDRSRGLREGIGRAGRQSSPTPIRGVVRGMGRQLRRGPEPLSILGSSISSRCPDWRRALHDPYGCMASRRTRSGAVALPMFCMGESMRSLQNAESAWSGSNVMAPPRTITAPACTPLKRASGSRPRLPSLARNQ